MWSDRLLSWCSAVHQYIVAVFMSTRRPGSTHRRQQEAARVVGMTISARCLPPLQGNLPRSDYSAGRYPMSYAMFSVREKLLPALSDFTLAGIGREGIPGVFLSHPASTAARCQLPGVSNWQPPSQRMSIKKVIIFILVATQYHS